MNPECENEHMAAIIQVAISEKLGSSLRGSNNMFDKNMMQKNFEEYL